MINTLTKAMLLAGLSCSTAFAGTMGPEVQAERDWVLALSLGPVWASSGTTQTFFLTPDIEKTYTANRQSNSLANGEIFVGQQKSLTDGVNAQLGLALAVTGDAHVHGNIWDDADPAFNNYLYTYKIRSTRLMVKGVAIADKGWFLDPFVSAGLGVSINRAHAFDNTPLIFEAVPNANFTDKTKSNFSYTLAAGVQKSFQTHWQAGVRYEFADWGNSQLGLAPGQSLGSGLKTSHVYTNGVLFHIAYIV